MKRQLLLLVLVITALAAHAKMKPKQYTYNGFAEQRKNVPKVLDELSSPRAKQHPEYGILPYNAQCTECVELIDKRTEFNRTFIDPKNPKHGYNQTSFFPLHFRKDDKWVTIDPLLYPQPGKQEVYAALSQPVPAILNLTEGFTSLNPGFNFKFNQGLLMYLLNANGDKIYTGATGYDQKTVGKEGMYVTNLWPGIDMRQTFRKMEVETDYVIPKPLQLPADAVWMVMEDHITLEDGYTIASKDLQLTGKCVIKGDLIITGPLGNKVAHLKVPTFYDNNARGTFGYYEVTKAGNEYTCKMYVPVNWLKRADNAYPLTLDPLYAADTLGAFDSWAPALTPADMAFTYFQTGSCDYKLTVTLPGDATISNTFIDLEYRNTYNPLCDAPAPDTIWQGCRRDELTMEVIDSICGNSTGALNCNANNNGDTTSGTCTTNPMVVPGAQPVSVPTFLNCIQPQCDPLDINFTLKNRSYRCPESCGYECAKGSLWMITIEYIPIQATWEQDKITVCTGQPVTFTGHGQYGVPPYSYHFYVNSLQGQYDTISSDSTLTIYPLSNTTIICVTSDMCNVAAPNLPMLTVTVIDAPPADAGGPFYLCEGGVVVLGGTPTTSGATTQWTAATVQSGNWIAGTGSPNPNVTVPPGTIDTFYYYLRAANPLCFRLDTALVISLPNPQPVIDSAGGTRICNGQSVGLLTTDTFTAYAWNNGANTSATSVSQPGSYFVVVTDEYGCTGTSTSIIVTQLNVPDIDVFPDTLIFYGDSVALYTDANFANADSFFWYPDVAISCTDCVNPSVAPTVDRYYGLVMYDQGCRVSDSALIRVILPTNFFIPNAFTPNGDGKNDFFFLFSQSGVEVRDFKVFNRWGEKVHDSVFEWDGNYKGKPSPQGVYVYIFQLKVFGEMTDIIRKGSVTLIR